MHIDLPEEKQRLKVIRMTSQSNLCCIKFRHCYVDIECIIFAFAIGCIRRIDDDHQNGHGQNERFAFQTRHFQ